MCKAIHKGPQLLKKYIAENKAEMCHVNLRISAKCLLAQKQIKNVRFQRKEDLVSVSGNTEQTDAVRISSPNPNRA